jgi:hypothetical protein
MGIPSELRQKVINTLSRFVDASEAEKYIDLDYLNKQVQESPPPWQALTAIGVYTAEIYNLERTQIEETFLKELVDTYFDTLEKLFNSIVSASESPIKDEQARLLFHTRFALGFLLLAKSEKGRSKEILHAMMDTKLNLRGQTICTLSNVLDCTNDVREVKLQTFFYLLVEYLLQKDFLEILFLITESIACTTWATEILKIVPVVLDVISRNYINTDDYSPGLEWLWLFTELGELLSLYQEYDASNIKPYECKQESAQFLTWKIGQMAGIFAEKWSKDPFKAFEDYRGVLGKEEYQSERGEEKTKQTIMVISALLSEYQYDRDWHKAREKYFTLWEMADTYAGMPLSEIGPCHDLYWAMKIGFIDRLLNHGIHEITENDLFSDPKWSKKLQKDMKETLDNKFAGEAAKEQSEIVDIIKLGENEYVEFKSSANYDFKKKCEDKGRRMDIIKTIAAFLNSSGGSLLIGVSDDKKLAIEDRILGLAYDYKSLGINDPGKYMEFLVDVIKDNINSGKSLCSTCVHIKIIKIYERDLCMVRVQKGFKPAWVKKSENETVLYIRDLNTTQPLRPDEAHDYINERWPEK